MPERPEVLIVQHVAVEGPGLILANLEAAGAAAQTIRVDRGMSVPHSLAGFSGLVVMGGPMGVYETEKYPHLRDELTLLEDALARRAPVLGICLGSQLLAAALGARVQPSGGTELGWLDVELSDAGWDDPAFAGCPPLFRPLHWHGDVFDLPAGAVSLARSDRTQHQAFRAERALGLLFHLEVQPAQVAEMARLFAGEVAAAGVDRADLIAQSADRAERIAPVARQVFGDWAASLL
ncbi:MAG TPA: gamma-glutamyl-gamma-aminobutyrate hydrolase family protein [Polyangiaceae bacterium]|nr:gamma-glutamyl-gamma-aminobutyrate hydrolase family protein [Polyangiaceae bacterium]